MNSRERILAAINHQETDRIPVDLGSTVTTGIHVSVVTRVRKALGIYREPVRVVEPYGMLGEVDEELREALGIDLVALWPPETVFGFPNADWKKWTIPDDGTEVQVPGGFNTDSIDGNVYQYPNGDKSLPPSASKPEGAYYFDNIGRQQPIDEDHLNVQDNLDDYQLLTDEQLAYYAAEADRLHHQTDKAVLGLVYGTNFGDPGYLAAPWKAETKGIRSTEEWYISLGMRMDYVKELFQGQCEMAIKNLELVHQAVRNKIDIINICANDLGGQAAPLYDPQSYDDLFLPVHKKLNTWIHEYTGWKTFFHTDGAIDPFMNSILDAGFDILNPIQWTAQGMDREDFKRKHGKNICFWGGGIDTQNTLPSGTPQEVYDETRECISLFRQGGGYVFCTIHCVLPDTPTENFLAMFEAIKDESALLAKSQTV